MDWINDFKKFWIVLLYEQVQVVVIVITYSSEMILDSCFDEQIYNSNSL